MPQDNNIQQVSIAYEGIIEKYPLGNQHIVFM